MIDLVSLLFIAMIPTDCKFFLTLVCLHYFAAIVIFGELTSTTSKERMTTSTIFTRATPIKVSAPISGQSLIPDT